MQKSFAASLIFVQLCAAAATAKDVPFTLTGYPVGSYIQCTGPWFRTSGCVEIKTDPSDPFGRIDNWNFYTAEDNFLFPITTGNWNCWVTTSGPDRSCDKHVQPTEVFFRIDNNTTAVRLMAEWHGGFSVEGTAPPNARAVSARSVLGQNGEDDRTPAQDQDIYNFAGKSGEKVKVRLDRDGSAGSDGQIATLRVRTPMGNVLGERTGPIPLVLDVTLPGPVEIAVSRLPGKGNALRGYYTLEVAPRSGDSGERQLVPAASVER